MGSQTVLTAISPEEAESILAARPGGILIGGGALAFWRADGETPLPSALEAGVTTDIDFFRLRHDAITFAENMKVQYHAKVEVFIPGFDDATPNSAKVVIYGYGGRTDEQYIEIDYLAVVYGFSHKEQERMRDRAPLITGDNIEFSVMHPLDVLKSRICNLFGLPQKQNDIGRAQSKLSIEVVRDWFMRDAGVGNPAYERSGSSGQDSALHAAEEIIELATHRCGLAAFNDFGIDVLTAIPAENFATDKFRNHRWPQALAFVKSKRRS